MNDIYIIVWTGRDSESGVWDTYPCYNYGYFTNKDSAQEFADILNKTEPREYDEDANDMETYGIQVIHYENPYKNQRGNK